MKMRHIIVVVGALGVLWGAPAYAEAPTTQKATGTAAFARTTSTPTPEIICSCVQYVHSQIPNFPVGDADKQVPNGTPQVGGVVIFQYGSVGHVAIIKAILTDGFNVSEFNFHHCQHSERFVRWDDPAIRGFWHD